MNKPRPENTWSELTPEQRENLDRQFCKRAEDHGALANVVWMEFCKYLFAANAGAAAGLFLLPDSSGQRWYLMAFSLFCLGVFCVGVAWYGGWSYCLKISDGWNRDSNAVTRNEMTFGALDAEVRTRVRSLRLWLSRIGLVVSFILLMAGGAVAANAFWSKSDTKPVVLQPTTAVPAKR